MNLTPLNDTIQTTFKKIKYSRNKFNGDVQDLHTEDYRTL